MAEPISVAVRRGGTVESVHHVHAVAVRNGEILEAAGDAAFVTFLRSSAKPIQALPLARERGDVDDRDLAIASASHVATEEQLAAVRALLAKAEATEDDLECGPYEGSRLNHNCSGKHAGMLALCHSKGWATQGYGRPEHPCQQAMLAEIANAAELDAASMVTAIDGCGVVTVAMPLRTMAHAVSRIERIAGGGAVAGAMRAHPELMLGPVTLDTELMRAHTGWIAKGGAEALLCAASPDGLGIALKVEDGSARALRPALGAFLAQLGLEPGPFGPVELRNSRDDVVGSLEKM
ncbi:MAG: asparaginase [Actinobacteria bacterium]|nr:asparaginase [Actinomycetota bacterium]